jgi:Pyruvate formate lyase-like
MDTLHTSLVEQAGHNCWRGFESGRWTQTIDLRDFIVRNLIPYEGDESFLAGPSARTQAVWATLQPMLRDERSKGVLDVDAATPSTILAHAPGWIDRDNEVIVGLQTDRPFRRAIFPAGGLRMVESGLKAAGFEADPAVHEAFTRYRKTHNDGVFDAHTPEIMRCRRSSIITGLPDAYGRGRYRTSPAARQRVAELPRAQPGRAGPLCRPAPARRTDLDRVCGKCGQRDRGQAHEQEATVALEQDDGAVLPRRSDSRAERHARELLSTTLSRLSVLER